MKVNELMQMKKKYKIPIIILILIPVGVSCYFVFKSLDHGEYLHETYDLPANQWAVYNITFKPEMSLSIEFHTSNYNIPWWFVNLSQFSLDLNSLDKSNFNEIPPFGYIEKNCYGAMFCFESEFEFSNYIYTEQTPRHRIYSFSNYFKSGEYAFIVNNTYSQNKEVFVNLDYHVSIPEWTLSLIALMFSYPLLLFMLFVVYKDENIIQSVKVLVASRKKSNSKPVDTSMSIHLTQTYIPGSGFVYKLVEEHNNRIGKLFLTIFLIAIIVISLTGITFLSQGISG